MSKQPPTKNTTSRNAQRKSLFIAFALVIVLGCTAAVLITMDHHNKRSSVSKNQQSKQAAVTLPSLPGLQREPCRHTAGATCIVAPAVDFYPADNEYHPLTSLNPSFGYDGATTGAHRDICGRITKIAGDAVSLLATNGETYTITFPINAVENFNSNYAAQYNPSPSFRVGPGAILYITYYDPDYFAADEGSTNVSAKQLEYSSVIIKPENYKAQPAAPTELLE